MTDYDYRNDIDDILDWFDFDRVHKVMVHLDWRWGLSGEVPEIPELRKRARQLMNEVVTGLLKSDKEEHFIETGGFRVVVSREKDDPKIYIRLSFELANWDNYA